MIKKTRKTYICQGCGTTTSKWHGQCPDCKEWNSFKELAIHQQKNTKTPYTNHQQQGFSGLLSSIQTLDQVNIQEAPRFTSGFEELDRVLGGGFTPGSVIVIGGHPGAGKSTILLQTLCFLSQSMRALYVSGEESLQQIATRAHRLHLPTQNLYMLAETSVEQIIALAEQEKPQIMVIDSIQVMYVSHVESAPGGLAQVRESAAYLTQYAKRTNTLIIFVGHVTKDHSLAGPMTLSHIVDTQLMLTNSEDSRFRMIRSMKNRFGQVNELGIFAMTEKGLKEVKNPSAIFLNRSTTNASGSIINVLWEGTRPLLVEIQALVVDSQLGNPRRVTVGIEQNRLTVILAVLSRHGGLFTASQDIFVNVVGGVRISETSADLSCLLAIVSSLRDIPLPCNLVAFGEIGLAGEIRPVSSGQERILEASKHGFVQAIVPEANKPKKKIDGMEIIGVSSLQDALKIFS